MDAFTWSFFSHPDLRAQEWHLSSWDPDLPLPETLCQGLACLGHTLPLFLLHPLPLYSPLTQMPLKPIRTGLLQSPLHWCCERSALQVSRNISARVRHALSPPKEQPPSSNPQKTNKQNNNLKNLHKAKHNSRSELWWCYLLAALPKLHTPRRKCIWTLHRYSQQGERLGRIFLPVPSLKCSPAGSTSAAVRESSLSLCAW